MSGVNLANYTTLSQYAILAGVALTNTVTVSTTVNGGYWYAPTINPVPLVSGTAPTGLNSTLAATATSELAALISAITTYTSTLTQVPIGAGGVNPPSNIFYPNRSYTGTGITYASSEILTFDAQGDSNAQFFITDRGTGMSFTGVTVNLINGAQPCNIYWLSNPTSGDGGFTISTSPTTTFPGIIITTAPGASTSSSTFTTAQNFSGHIYSKTSVTFTTTGPVSVNSNTCPVVCYLKGTLILTQRGLVPVEKLKAGQSIVTKGKINFNKYHNKNANIKVETLLWVSKFKVVDLNSKSRPICIKKDALGENKPFKDLYVSPGHSLLLNGEMVRANRLINGTTIYQDNDCDDVEYYHVELDSHSAVFANGILAESYLALNNRHVFENSISLRIKPTHNLKNIQALR